MDSEFEPAAPNRILKLSQSTINQIAAAEIIHRPSSAIKELLENSLDAGASQIKVTLKEGGLKQLTIQDNGHGIGKDDLPLLCERYATSKLRVFDDLKGLGTYGFRGEALASISYCSHVEVVTKTKDGGVAWKALYEDGKLVAPKPGQSVDPRPTAGNDGTTIIASDLFYNIPIRKRSFKSPTEEYTRTLTLLTKYAIHNPHVSWTLKKHGTSLPDIVTQAGTTISNIKALYGPSVAAELLEVEEKVLEPEETLGASCKGWVSGANSTWTKKGQWLLFINNRLVESSKIKKALESLYTAYLPKGSTPFIYLALSIDPAKIDVNIHPTKSEVSFLNEDEMVEAIVAQVGEVLKGGNKSRNFTVQTLLPGVRDSGRERKEGEGSSSSIGNSRPAANYKVRMDPTNRTLDSMVQVVDPSQLSSFVPSTSDGQRPTKRRAVSGVDGGVTMLDEEEEGQGQEDEDAREMVRLDVGEGSSKGKGKEIEESVCEFTSIQALRKAVLKNASSELHEILSRHAFVGQVSSQLTLSLIQHATKLFLVNHAALADEHFYQLALRQFGAFNRIKLEPQPNLRELLTLAVEDEEGLGDAGLSKEDVVDYTTNLLVERAEMLDEYFSLLLNPSSDATTPDATIETLPLILRGYTPNLDRLPHFLLCIATRVNWDDERECFETFLRELAFFYSPRPFSDAVEDTGEGGEEDAGPTEEELSHQTWQLEHVLFPNFRRYTAWPKSLVGGGGLGKGGAGGAIQQVANLPDLFRIFERC
ncbi:DNA mismatch repair protein MLH1 [Cryptococcus wingfieldii CBS 7118]|uniref:DNA mismatch repair protein MLH1 n=1 Tax=Cryptococcus wingfieldii CBS 7118 TaxID=1295528 RepID=A0A1E3IW63_9TREE|nr:DNA mismatch repair protein MLH1 [Cryptococcus wingfieldii CBS 7118]ODN92837.1 DNA mismatch repair protein MLH1 [Cryptococcus wingfieldii CBS 7118]